MRKILSLLGLLLILALFFLGMALGREEGEARRDPPVSLPAVGTARGNDLNALTSVFGCGVPYSTKSGSGEVRDVKIGTLQARQLTWHGADGLETNAVLPREAAQLLNREGLAPDVSSLWTVNGHTLMLAVGTSGACAYYEDEDAAYSLFLPGADADSLLSLLAAGVTFPIANEPESR